MTSRLIKSIKIPESKGERPIWSGLRDRGYYIPVTECHECRIFSAPDEVIAFPFGLLGTLCIHSLLHNLHDFIEESELLHIRAVAVGFVVIRVETGGHEVAGD